jgi:predicted transcriptional regulator
VDPELDNVHDAIYACVVERTTIYLDPDLKRRLKAAALREGTTEAALIREALRRLLRERRQPAIRPVGRTRDGGVAHRADEALEELGFGRT